MAAASTFAVPRASDPARTGSEARTALAAPIASAVAQAARLPVRCHRHEGDLAPAGALHQLKAHLHAVAVRVVHDQLALTHEVCGPADRAPADTRGIGDLLHTDGDVHVTILHDQALCSQPWGRAAGGAGGISGA